MDNVRNLSLYERHKSEKVRGLNPISGAAQLYSSYFKSAERIKDIVFNETDLDSTFPHHPMASTGIVTYVMSIEAYINHYACLTLSVSLEKLSQRQIDNIYRLVNDNLSDKVANVWDLYDLKTPGKLNLEDVKNLINVRNQILHYAPIFHDGDEMRNAIIPAVKSAGLDETFKTDWSAFMSTPKMIQWAANVSEKYIRSLSSAGYGFREVMLTEQDFEEWKKTLDNNNE